MQLGSGREKRVLGVQQRSGAGRLVEGGSGAELPGACGARGAGARPTHPGKQAALPCGKSWSVLFFQGSSVLSFPGMIKKVFAKANGATRASLLRW